MLGGHIRALDNENCRKYAFGVYGVFGETDNLDIKGLLIYI